MMFLGLLAVGFANAQYDGKVGVNTETPSATLNVKSKIGKTTDDTKNFELLNAQNRVLMRVWDSRKASIGTEADTDDYLNIRNLFFFNWEKRAFGTGISAATVGGWARGYHFVTQDNTTNFGGFGAYGTPNIIKYFYIGQIPTVGTPTATFNYDTKNVGIGVISPSHKLHIKADADTDPLKLEGLRNATGKEDILVANAEGVVKKISKADLVNNNSVETEWIYDPSTKRINLKRSGQTVPVGTQKPEEIFQNEVYYNEYGQFVNAKGLTADRVKELAAKNILNATSDQLLTRTMGTSTFKVLNSSRLNIDEKDTSNNLRLNEDFLSLANDSNYNAIYNNNSSTTLNGSGTVSTALSYWGQSDVGGTRNVTGYISGVLGGASISTTGKVEQVYSLYGRNFFNTTAGANVTTSAAGYFYKTHIANDASLITNDIGVKIDLRNGSKNTGTGAYMAGVYNEVQVIGQTTYPNVYGIYTSNQVKSGAVAPANNYGVYIADVEGGKNTNYAIYTNKGTVSLGDELEVKGSIKVANSTNDTCDATKAGTIRFNATEKKFQGCTGAEWKDLHN